MKTLKILNTDVRNKYVIIPNFMDNDTISKIINKLETSVSDPANSQSMDCVWENAQ